MILDVFYAYGLPPNRELYDSLKSKNTFRYILDVYYSNKHPYTVMIIASKVGMYIPPKKRVGLRAYKFFLDNVKYYENVVERPLSIKEVPFESICLSKNKTQLLSYYRDDEIFRKGYKYSRDYDDRIKALEFFLDMNFLKYGEFTLLTNNIKAYSSRAKTILYKKGGESIYFSVDELMTDIKREIFTREAYKNLYHAIESKKSQWINSYYVTAESNTLKPLNNIQECLRDRLSDNF